MFVQREWNNVCVNYTSVYGDCAGLVPRVDWSLMGQ